MSLKICPVSVAKQRLAEKETEVRKHLQQTAEFLDSVKVKNDLLTSSFDKQYEHVCNQFAILHNALNIKEKELCEQLQQELQGVSVSNKKLVTDAESLMGNITKVLQEADGARQNVEGGVEFIKKCSSITQVLEEMFLNLLLLLSSSETEDVCPEEKEVNLRGVLESIANVQLTSRTIHCKDRETPSDNTGDDQATTSSTSTPISNQQRHCSDKDVPVVHSNEVSSSTVDSNEAATITKTAPLTCASAKTNTETDSSQGPASVVLDVIVTCVVSPADMHVQLYGKELVELMNRMGKYYADLTMHGASDSVLSNPQIGDFCCAQFTQDDCWYRAVIMSVDQIFTTEGKRVVPTSNAWVTVQYIDYGNQEQLPLSRLQPLDPSFCSLPCQAIACSLAGIEPSTELPSNGENDVEETQKQWPPQINKWLEKLLLGKKVQISIVADTPDRYGVDILVPRDWILSEELLAAFPVSAQSVVNMPQLVKQEPLIHLSAFLSHTGVAGSPVPSAIDAQESQVSMPVADVDKEITVRSDPVQAKESSVQDSSISSISSHESTTSSPVPTRKRLSPLFIKLGAKADFEILISHVVSPREFYVNPIQEDIAQSMSKMEESLSKHYSISSNQQRLSPSAITSSLHGESNDILCCVQCPDDNQWYRGVISASTQQTDGCPVHLVDYGEHLVIQQESVFELAEEFCEYPALAVRCSLNGIDATTPTDDDYDPTGSDAPTVQSSCSSHVENMICKTLQKCSLRKKLVACVGDEGRDFDLEVEYGSLLSVDIIDTSGEQDMDIKRLSLEESKQLSSELPVPVTGAKLSEWNPMERDYLAQRNNYSIDDEDVGSALHGYKSTSRPCRFYNSEKGCFRGDECPFLHLQEGVTDQQLQEVFVSTDQVDLPDVNAVVYVVVTAIVSATRFYVQMPLGAKSVLNKTQDQDGVDLNKTFADLLEQMRDYYNQHVFSERNTVDPEVGEMVVVRYDADKQWYRARVVGTADSDKTKVFYVDYGHYDIVCQEDMRRIKEDFLVVPFQAVECFLPGLGFAEATSRGDKANAKEYFESLVSGQVLVARVVTRLSAGVLGLELYSDIHINKKLVTQGILRKIDTRALLGVVQELSISDENLTPG